MSDRTTFQGPGGADDPPTPDYLLPTPSRRLLRVPQIVGLVAVLGSVVVLVLAVFAPGIFQESKAQTPEVDIAELQLTAEAQYGGPQPTSEVALSDLAPTAEPSPTPAGTAPPEPEGTAAPAPTATATAAPPPVENVQIGVALEEFPGEFGAIGDFGELSGRLPDMVMFFQAWGNGDRDFKDWLPVLSSMGVTPFITWEPWDRNDFIDQQVYTQASILAGEHDPYIDEWARQAAAFEAPIYLRFAHEMNTPLDKTYWYPWQGDPEQYIAVWRYVHARFQAVGADNVRWVWSVAWMNDDALLYYPGSDYVDLVGLTVLNFGAGKPDSSWRSFAELYGIQQSRVLAYDKPVIITELGTAEQGGDKGAWIAAIGGDIQERFPEIRALVWLNYSESREFEAINWRVDSSPEALAGWLEQVNHPIFEEP